MINVMLEQGLEVEHHRTPIHQRQRDHTEGGLQGGVLVEIVEYRQRPRVFLELDHDSHAVAIRLVVEVGDAFQFSLADQLIDARDQRRLVHHVGNLGDDDPLPAILRLFEGMAGADDQPTVTGPIGGGDALATDDDAAGWKVRSPDQLHEVLGGGLGVVDQPEGRIAHLAQVMRWDVRRHADRDP